MGPVLAVAAVAAGAAAVGYAIHKSTQRNPVHAPSQRELNRLSHQDNSLSTQVSANAVAQSQTRAEEARIERQEQAVQASWAAIEARKYAVQVDTAQLAQRRDELERQTFQLQEEKKANQLKQRELETEGARLLEAQAEVRRKRERIEEINARDWPRPDWLRDGCHVGITGRTGAGKSSLINAVLAEKVAKVGVTETTMEPSMYTARRGPLNGLVVCDMPGAGTAKFPADSYIKEMGIRYFYTLLIVTATRFEKMDYNLFHEARRWEIPCYLVRSKVDVDIESNLDDHDWPAEKTVAQIRDDLISNIKRHPEHTPEDDRRVFVVSAKRKFEEVLMPDLDRLVATILKDIDEKSETGVDEQAAGAARPASGAGSASRGPAAAASATIGGRGLPSILAEPLATYTGPAMQAPSQPLQSNGLWKKADTDRLALGR